MRERPPSPAIYFIIEHFRLDLDSGATQAFLINDLQSRITSRFVHPLHPLRCAGALRRRLLCRLPYGFAAFFDGAEGREKLRAAGHYFEAGQRSRPGERILLPLAFPAGVSRVPDRLWSCGEK